MCHHTTRALSLSSSHQRRSPVRSFLCAPMERNAPYQCSRCTEVHEPLIGIQYPMLCGPKNGQWHIGTASIRENSAAATGLHFVNWAHHDHRDDALADRRGPLLRPTGVQRAGSPMKVSRETMSWSLPLDESVHRIFKVISSSPESKQMQKPRLRLQVPQLNTALSCMEDPTS